MSPETFNKYGFLKRIRDNINNLPEIKAYYEKENAMKAPFIPPFAVVPF